MNEPQKAESKKGGRSGRKHRDRGSPDADNWLNPSVGSEFKPRAREDPQTERLIAKLNDLTQDGDMAVLASWIKDQDWAQISKCLILHNVREGSSSMSALHGLAHFIKPYKSAAQDAIDFVVQAYVRAGCDVNEVCNELQPRRRSRAGFTPLLLAIERQQASLVKALIRAGADVNKADSCGWSPLHWVCYQSLDTDAVAELVNAGADLNKGIQNVPPPIHVAIDEGRVQIVAFLLSQGVEVNTEWTYNVIKEECWALLKSRYDCGASLKDCENKKISCIGRAVRMRKLPTLAYLLKQPKARVRVDDLHFCILEGDTRTANILLEHMDKGRKADLLPNDKINGTWALHALGASAFVSKYEPDVLTHTKALIRTYVEYGWDINSVSLSKNNGLGVQSLLIWAVEMGQIDLIQFLLENGAHCRPPKDLYNSLTAFHLAIFKGNIEAIRALAEHPSTDMTQELDIEPTRFFVDAEFQRQNMTFMDILLVKRAGTAGNNNVAKMMESIVTAGFRNSKITPDLDHLLFALKGLNERVVLAVVKRLPEQVSLKGFTSGGFPALQVFVNDIDLYDDSIPILMELIKCFHSKGYDLNDSDNACGRSLGYIAVSWVIERDLEALMFNFLTSLPQFNWNVGRGGSEPIERAFELCAICSNPKTLTRIRKVAETLLHLGVRVENVSVVNILKKDHPGAGALRTQDLVKELWWAGADFTGFEDFLKDQAAAATIGEEERKAVNNLSVWWDRVGRTPHLTRLVAIAVRKSLQHQDLKSLPGPSLIKDLVKEIPGHLF